jgi:hypothetical protein
MLAQPVASALDVDNDGVVKQPVKQRGGNDRIAEYLPPFGKAAIRGQDHRTAFVAGIRSSLIRWFSFTATSNRRGRLWCIRGRHFLQTPFPGLAAADAIGEVVTDGDLVPQLV